MATFVHAAVLLACALPAAATATAGAAAAAQSSIWGSVEQVHIALGLEPTSMNVAWATTHDKCSQVPAPSRCVVNGTTTPPNQGACEAAGCCFDAARAPGSFACYASQTVDQFLCAVPGSRQPCAAPNPTACSAAGCCWDDAGASCHARRDDLSVTLSYREVAPGAGANASVARRGGARAESVEVASDVRILNVSGAGCRFTHTATLSHLDPGAQYNFSVAGHPLNFSFAHRRPQTPARPQRHIIFGDLGATHGFSLCEACTAGSAVCDAETCAKTPATGLIAETDSADMWLHVGDFAYNFDGQDGYIGDQFMRNIEQVAGNAPYMVSHGNHEDSAVNLAHYVERFRNMPANAEPSTFTTAAGTTANSMFYSWDAGLVHYIALSTELWYGVEDGELGNRTLAAAKKWLEKDLIAANANRGAVPWVVAHGHRDMYCSANDHDVDCTSGKIGAMRVDLEALFFKYGLDLWINGHEHNYERMYPVHESKSEKCDDNCYRDPDLKFQHVCRSTCKDPNATIYIVTGAAGSSEMHSPFDLLTPSWTAYRSNTFGYSRFIAHNATHAQWQQVQTDPNVFTKGGKGTKAERSYGGVIDELWIVQERHGPFDLARAPTGTAWPEGDDTAARTYDHWGPLLGFGDGTEDGKTTLQHIKEFKAKHGEAAYGAKLDKLLREVNIFMHSQTGEWEDVRGDGSDTGAWFRWKDQSDNSIRGIMRG